ncbi:DMT family transporter [Alloscardovia omnicolens]|uniref:DMT family transporter n=1 Tax=Alloscardovia omnicolens TaxID=419015 RepID=UPI003A76DB54
MSPKIMGSAMVLCASIAWGISGVSGQYLLQRGISVSVLTSLRLIIAGAVLVAIVLIRNPRSIRKACSSASFIKDVLIFSIFGLMANQFAYLQAIKYTNAGTATVLQYLTPVIVLAYTCVKHKIPPALLEILAVILAISGTYLLATHGQIDALAINPSGLFWGIFSAFTYAAYIILPVKLVQQWGSLLSIGMSMLVGGIIFSLVTRIWTQRFIWDGPILLGYTGIIGVGTIIAYTLFLKGTAYIGPVQGSLLASVEPVASVIFTVALFHLHFYPADFVGMIIIVIAALMISLKNYIARIFTHSRKA